MMVGDGYGIKSLRPTCPDQLLSVSLPFLLADRVFTTPVEVAGSVDLKIAFVEVCAFVHMKYLMNTCLVACNRKWF